MHFAASNENQMNLIEFDGFDWLSPEGDEKHPDAKQLKNGMLLVSGTGTAVKLKEEEVKNLKAISSVLQTSSSFPHSSFPVHPSSF